METAGNTVSAIVPTAEDPSLSGTDDEYDGIEYDGLPVKCGMLAISLLCNGFEDYRLLAKIPAATPTPTA
jgi:hypothetical protein